MNIGRKDPRHNHFSEIFFGPVQTRFQQATCSMNACIVWHIPVVDNLSISGPQGNSVRQFGSRPGG